MATVRPMEPGDIPGAVAAFDQAFGALRARLGLPPTSRPPGDERRIRRRVAHFLSSDPGGSWVADHHGRVVGLAQAFVREGLWVLSLLGVSPERQAGGLGQELLARAMAHGDASGPGMILCSRDSRAMALYTRAGFELHPALAAAARTPVTVERPAGVRRGGPGDLPPVTAIDRAVRGAGRPGDLAFLLGEPGNRLLLDGEDGYAVATDDRVVMLGARTEKSAARVLAAALAEANGGTVEVNWVTAPQQWAIRTLAAAGVGLLPTGPVMLRGRPGPPAPYLPSGGYG
jgi:ribosomal protein S18 acetylase RimI-like enzyme